MTENRSQITEDRKQIFRHISYGSAPHALSINIPHSAFRVPHWKDLQRAPRNLNFDCIYGGQGLE